jgi:hypothetical protein
MTGICEITTAVRICYLGIRTYTCSHFKRTFFTAFECHTRMFLIENSKEASCRAHCIVLHYRFYTLPTEVSGANATNRTHILTCNRCYDSVISLHTNEGGRDLLSSGVPRSHSLKPRISVWINETCVILYGLETWYLAKEGT